MSINSLQDKVIIFVLKNEKKEFSCKARFLLSCEYFNNMLNSGMKEAQSGRISVPYSSRVFKSFISYLKTGNFPTLNFQEMIEFFELAHKYQHFPLLNKIILLLTQEMPQHYEDILITASFLDYKDLKVACHNYIQNNHPNKYYSLLSSLIDKDGFSAVEEVLTWEEAIIYPMMTYSDSNNLSSLHKFIKKKQFSLAVKYIKRLEELEINITKIIESQIIYYFLDQIRPPLTSEEHNFLIFMIKYNPSSLIETNFSRNNPILHFVLKENYNSLFKDMLNICKKDVSELKNSSSQSLLSAIISLKNHFALKALKEHCLKINSSFYYYNYLKDYILAAIRSQDPLIVQEIITFPGVHQRLNGLIEITCIEEAINSEKTKILEILWPYFKDTFYMTQLQKKIFENNRYDLTPFIFSENFNSSLEYPYEQPPRSWLHQAVLKGTIEWITLMLEKSTDINLQSLLEFPEHDEEFLKCNRSETIPMTPFLTALVYLREETIIKKFLSLTLKLDINIGNEAFAPIHFIHRYNKSLLRSFLSFYPKLNISNFRKENFFHLYFSRENDCLTLIEFKKILKNLDSSALLLQDNKGNTPFHYAIQKKLCDKAFLLLDHNPQVLWKQNQAGIFPLKILGKEDFIKTTNFIVTLAINEKKEKTKEALLLWSAEQGLYTFCNRLIQARTNLEIRGRNEESLLHLGVQFGSFLGVTKLIEAGCPINSQNKKGKTPLYLAVAKENYKIAALLVQKGANPNIINQEGKTPLFLAVKKENLKIVHLLLEKGANPELPDEKGETPLSFALKSNYPRSADLKKIIELLENASCKVQ